MQPKYRFAVLFSAGTGVRIGEMAARRRSDLTIICDDQGRITRARVRVDRAVIQAKGLFYMGLAISGTSVVK